MNTYAESQLADTRNAVQALREQGRVPRAHGNGFVQLDIEPGLRLNVWGHPLIPRQSTSTAIHDHRFGFESEVLVGRMINVRYNISYAGSPTHDILTPVPTVGEDTRLDPHPDGEAFPQGVRLVSSSADVIGAEFDRPCYFFPARWIHETVVTGPTATLMRKGDVVADYVPRVFVAVGCKPDNAHRRESADPELLWQIIDEVLGQ